MNETLIIPLNETTSKSGDWKICEHVKGARCTDASYERPFTSAPTSPLFILAQYHVSGEKVSFKSQRLGNTEAEPSRTKALEVRLFAFPRSPYPSHEMVRFRVGPFVETRIDFEESCNMYPARTYSKRNLPPTIPQKSGEELLHSLT